MSHDEVDRRSFISIVAAGAVVGACSGPGGEGDPENDDGAGSMPGEFRDSPMLAEQVEAGDLPPVKERLPKEPYVVQPGLLVNDQHAHMEPGRYGGTLQLAQDTPTSSVTVWTGEREPILWAVNGFEYGKALDGNVVAGWEANDDDTVYTFHMRDGLKWSDGEPVTVEDVRFAFEDVLLNEQITPALPQYLVAELPSGRAAAKLTVVDDLTFSLAFDQSYGAFPAQLAIAFWTPYWDIIKPFHYLQQFHEKYASKSKLAELVDEASLPEGEWFNLFNAKQLHAGGSVSNAEKLGHPTLTPWIMKQADAGVFTYERNPYYFKVDMEGNQLPYMDGLRSQTVQDKETLMSRALFGEFDYLGERQGFRTLPLMAEKAEQGEINLLVPRQHVDPTTLFLNLTHPDEVWREVVRDLRFRQALSLALNREELIENFYLGEFASIPTETNPGDYDPDEANRLLDEMGLDQRDNEDWRLGPDGKRFVIPFEVADLSENHIPLGELVTEHWKNVGLYTTLRQIDATLRGERQVANDLKADVIWLHSPIWRYAAGWADYLPQNTWGPLWQQWYTSQGESGEEPIPEVKELFGLHEQFKAARLGTPESESAIDGIIQSHHDNLWVINPFEDAYWPTFFTSRLKNVPSGVKRDVFGIIVSYSMEQWYLDSE